MFKCEFLSDILIFENLQFPSEIAIVRCICSSWSVRPFSQLFPDKVSDNTVERSASWINVASQVALSVIAISRRCGLVHLTCAQSVQRVLGLLRMSEAAIASDFDIGWPWMFGGLVKSLASFQDSLSSRSMVLRSIRRTAHPGFLVVTRATGSAVSPFLPHYGFDSFQLQGGTK